ncbi:MAG: tripartite tricarboxylate transporter substrate binding protein [Xanthobacteraceae bacterium]|nr:tripartite tricarboxylate transporter substrate binding protein [Xanthobacteraceae bacterium]
MTVIRTLLASAFCIAGALHFTGAAQAQAWPTKQPVKIVVPFPAGGPTDGMARIVSDRLGAVLHQSIVVENRGGGAGGSVGAKFVASSDPDGYTILLTPGGSLTTGPAVHKNIGYDPAKVFTPVAQVMETPLIIAVHPDLPVKSLQELVAYGKANPGKVSWGSQGFGVAPHLLLELFKLETKVNFTHVPYRGTAPMLTAVVAGEVQVVADPMTTVLPHIQSGKLRAIAIAGPTRSDKLPGVPTTGEQGYPKIDSPFWLGVVVPAGTPADVVTKLNAAFRDALNDPTTKQRLANLGAEIKIGTPDAFKNMLAKELALWTGVVKDANITVE